MYPNANQRHQNDDYNYPTFTQQNRSNTSAYVPTAPTAYDTNNPYLNNNGNYNNPTNNNGLSGFEQFLTGGAGRNNSNQNPVNTQAMTAATGIAAQSRGSYHGAGYNPAFQEDELMNKDLDNTLQGGARAGFIRKVYTLLTLQLLVTIAIGYWAYNSDLFKKVFVNIPALIILSVLLIVFSCMIGCATTFFRKWALPIFIAFTLIFALLIGISISGYKSKIVLMAAGITFLLVSALTLYACVTKSDFTTCGPYLLVVCLVLCVFGIVLIFWRDPIAHLVYSCLSALLFAIYLIFDTQLVLGRGMYSYTLDDAYLASIQLYIDIMELFLHILQILAFVDNN